ncbi:MAG: hypothetical protein ACI4WY_05635 [Anaerovoracaceae bacterium]
MKQFIYLDTDIVNSIIAQNQKGIVVQQTLSGTSTDNKSENTITGISGDARVSGSFFKMVEAVGNLGINRNTDRGHSSTLSASDVIEKVLHDAAFDIAYEYINPNSIAMGNQEYDEEGNYILIKRNFDFVDLDYLESLFSQNGLIDFLKKTEEEKIREEFENSINLNREQHRNNKSEINKEIKKLIDLNNQQYEDARKVIEVFRTIIPYNRMLISSDGYLIPLDEQYFRINPKNLGFKYGGEITCVGMVTNIIGEETKTNDEDNIFATLQYTASEALLSLLPTRENNVCVIHPIAIYYGD